MNGHHQEVDIHRCVDHSRAIKVQLSQWIAGHLPHDDVLLSKGGENYKCLKV